MKFLNSHQGRQATFAYIVLSPAILYFTVYFFYPIAVELWASFFRGQPLIGDSEFAGFDNYMQALTDERVRDAFIRTAVFAICGTIGTLLPALCLAAILVGPVKAATTIRAIIFFPYIISFVIVALMWKSILDPYTGMLNAVLASLGLPMQNWLSTPSTALPTIIAVTVWKDIGYAMLIYIAAIQSIPKDLYEAADVDGASARQKFFRITVPLLTPTTLFLAVISMIAHLQDLSAPYLLTGGGPAEATRLYALHVYETAFVELNIGYASALSFLMLIVILIVTALQFRFLNREISY
ncbi:sugar ABC transporter permease [Rhizobium laguerreae]|uniref:Carbohydrate ABC transporter membrane protein 1 (CUT1 family) n=1 Tax=Rhizobium laguerreae TaxID=1076926 RepID=A0A1S9GHH8_9HYPH|nr:MULTISPECIES: sugar ABC transporter permease [Rhizobium]MBB3165019.1 multiple sugar transport system permease protein [Rhizobium laguerreae]MBY3067714.1 sugar ABC transporter permease [Rhizobium laguerreae]MBY3081269.1 sugar ABC transporter permease [Rhizobium laguerreae]MBY3083139.1 sugar ABC transporter permease [Rhizobium laguerreae]MBY3115166.1 sugar ABC transporter permease [Rhizobium laguerreae]